MRPEQNRISHACLVFPCRLVSTVHALIVGLFCLYILWFDDVVNADPVW